MKIEIYYAEVCGLCHKALDFFAERQLPVQAHKVEWDGQRDRWVDSKNVHDMLRRAGEVDFVPQIFINESHHISGWRQLEPMIQSGAFDRLIEEMNHAD